MEASYGDDADDLEIEYGSYDGAHAMSFDAAPEREPEGDGPAAEVEYESDDFEDYQPSPTSPPGDEAYHELRRQLFAPDMAPGGGGGGSTGGGGDVQEHPDFQPVLKRPPAGYSFSTATHDLRDDSVDIAALMESEEGRQALRESLDELSAPRASGEAMHLAEPAASEAPPAAARVAPGAAKAGAGPGGTSRPGRRKPMNLVIRTSESCERPEIKSYTLSVSGVFQSDQGFAISRHGIQQSPAEGVQMGAGAGAASGQAALPRSAGMQVLRGSAAPSRDFRVRSLDDLKMLEVLGHGAGGVVNRALHVPSGTVVAVKSMNVLDDEKRRQLMRELATLYCSDCDSIVVIRSMRTRLPAPLRCDPHDPRPAAHAPWLVRPTLP